MEFCSLLWCCLYFFFFTALNFESELASPTPKLERNSPMFSFSTRFISLHLGVIHLLFNMWYVCGMRYGSKFIFFQMAIQLSLHHLLRNLSLLWWLEMPPSSWIKFPNVFRPLTGLSSMFLWSVCLFKHQYNLLHYVDFIMYVLISGRMSCLLLFCFQGFCFLYFVCMKFRINYIALEKKLVFFIEIALNSYINLDVTGIFMMLNHPIQ